MRHDPDQTFEPRRPRQRAARSPRDGERRAEIRRQLRVAKEQHRRVRASRVTER